jgi:predicted nucleic acid-binding protein
VAYLIDTNVLLRSVDPNHPMYNDATNAISLLRNQGETLCIVPQNLIEFWNVYTRPANKNGLTHILTFNIEDFNRYAREITPVHPISVTSP